MQRLLSWSTTMEMRFGSAHERTRSMDPVVESGSRYTILRMFFKNRSVASSNSRRLSLDLAKRAIRRFLTIVEGKAKDGWVVVIC